MRVERGSGSAPLRWPEPAPALRGARAAFVSFSRLPLGGHPYRAAEWRWAPAHLPLVGMVVGALSAGGWWLALQAGLSALLAAIVALGVSVAVSGALHEDGLADAADGLGGGQSAERRLEIMKDSRIGSYGGLALGFSLLSRAAAIASLRPQDWCLLPLIHCLARLGPVRLMLAERYVTGSEAKSPLFLPIGRAQLAVALGWALLATLLSASAGWLPWASAACLLLVLTLLSALAGRYYRHAVGGISGDLLGALEQASEIALWLTALACRELP